MKEKRRQEKVTHNLTEKLIEKFLPLNVHVTLTSSYKADAQMPWIQSVMKIDEYSLMYLDYS